MSSTLLRPPTDGEAPGRVPHRRLVLVGGGLGLLALLVVYLVVFSPVFGARSIQVRGTTTLTAAQVEKAAGIPHGRPLVRLDSARAVERVERIPEVASATVHGSFPSTVVITVTERVPVGVVEVRAHDFRLVDRTGDQYVTVTKDPGTLPRFVLPGGVDAAAVRATAQAESAVAGALAQSLRARIDSVQALDPDTITLLLHDGRVVKWGSAADSALKARILPTLLQQPGEQFDLTDPTQPVAH